MLDPSSVLSPKRASRRTPPSSKGGSQKFVFRAPDDVPSSLHTLTQNESEQNEKEEKAPEMFKLTFQKQKDLEIDIDAAEGYPVETRSPNFESEEDLQRPYERSAYSSSNEQVKYEELKKQYLDLDNQYKSKSVQNAVLNQKIAELTKAQQLLSLEKAKFEDIAKKSERKAEERKKDLKQVFELLKVKEAELHAMQELLNTTITTPRAMGTSLDFSRDHEKELKLRELEAKVQSKEGDLKAMQNSAHRLMRSIATEKILERKVIGSPRSYFASEKVIQEEVADADEDYEQDNATRLSHEEDWKLSDVSDDKKLTSNGKLTS